MLAILFFAFFVVTTQGFLFGQQTAVMSRGCFIPYSHNVRTYRFTVNPGDSVQFRCNSNYFLMDNAQAYTTCQNDGTWSAPFPYCGNGITVFNQLPELSVRSPRTFVDVLLEYYIIRRILKRCTFECCKCEHCVAERGITPVRGHCEQVGSCRSIMDDPCNCPSRYSFGVDECQNFLEEKNLLNIPPLP